MAKFFFVARYLQQCCHQRTRFEHKAPDNGECSQDAPELWVCDVVLYPAGTQNTEVGHTFFGQRCEPNVTSRY
jgi:hypothetical protein